MLIINEYFTKNNNLVLKKNHFQNLLLKGHQVLRHIRAYAIKQFYLF